MGLSASASASASGSGSGSGSRGLSSRSRSRTSESESECECSECQPEVTKKVAKERESTLALTRREEKRIKESQIDVEC